MLTLLLGAFSPALAQGDFSAGYRAETTLPAGMIVSLVSEDAREVAPASTDNLEDVLGVVVGGSNSLLVVSSNESNVQVATSGLVSMLVTDEVGTIRNGDYITLSNVDGIGRRASEGDSRIVGVARADFDSGEIQTVRTGEDEREVAVTRIPVMIQIGANPATTAEDSVVPAFFQETANALAGEEVAPSRVIVALIVAVGGLIGAIALLYGAVSNTIISIGRNPLSKKTIYAGLVRMVAIALGIIGLTLILAYVIVSL